MANVKTEVIEIKPIEMKTVEVTLIGDTPLIMHAWSEKAKRMMLEAQQGKAKGKKKPLRNPVDDFIQSIYWLTEKPEYSDEPTEEECEKAFEKAIANGAKFGFPVTAFKQAAISAAHEWRLHQSRHFINSIAIKVIATNDEEAAVRAFHIVTESSKYEPITAIIKEKSKREALLANALSELNSFKRKYEILSELTPVFKAIKEVNNE